MLPASLVNRISGTRFSEERIEQNEILRLIRAGIRASDHGDLKPFRFVLVEGDARRRLGAAMAVAYGRQNPDASESILERQKAKTLRAPHIIAVIFSPKNADIIPLHEQRTSAGCAAQMIVAEAYLMGLGAIWRTGQTVYSLEVANEMDLSSEEEVIACLYLGHFVSKPKKRKYLDEASFISYLEPIN
tara:strand:+ start:54 stop:617 length:564 start_codon:yes stop_codon:yes gene_type:complete